MSSHCHKPPGHCQRSAAWAVMVGHCVLILAAGPVRAGSAAPTEYEVKAAFIYNFAKYVQWPGLPRTDSNRPFVIGLIGKDPFGLVLDDVMSGQTIQRRPVVVRRFGRVEEIVNCDILFVSSTERRNLDRIFATLSKVPVLTIGDMDHFAEHGGMINLTTEEDNRIRFEVNVKAIGRAGLKAGSQLLRLARIVNEPQSGK